MGWEISNIFSKLLLNSLWGKMSQRPNPSTVIITKSAKQLHELLEDPTREVVDFCHLNAFLDRVVVRQKPEFLKPPSTNNVVIASFVTSHGRRRTYQAIQEAIRLGHQLIYTDTDSIVTKRRVDQPRISEGRK
jgi:hypothetical protein